MKIADSLMCLLSAVFKAIIPKIQKEPEKSTALFYFIGKCSYEIKSPPGDAHSCAMKFVASDRARRENAPRRILSFRSNSVEQYLYGPGNDKFQESGGRR